MRSIRGSIRAVRALGASVALALSLAGCSNELPAPIPTAHPDATVPRRGGTLTSASFGDLRTLDPANVGDGLVVQMLEEMFAGLVDYDQDGKIYPDLADHWTVSDDGTSLRFVLREGVRFHDGEEVTADDVKRSVERALHPTAPNPYSSYFASIVGYTDFTEKKAEHLEGVSVEGRYVVTFKLDKPDAAFLPLLAMHPLRPVCRSGGTRYLDTWHPCGAGPFKLLPGGWDRGRQITLVRHEGYFRPGLPYLDEVRFLFHVNQTSQRFKFTTGDLDILRDFLSPDLPRFQADPRWKAFGEYELDKQLAGLAMNTEMAPFDNVELRRAVATALDREQLTLVRAANLRPAWFPVPPAVEGYDPTLKGQHFDLAEALEHMKRAGYPYDPVTRTGGYPHPIPYLTYSQGLDEYMVQVTQQQLARIGIRLDVRIVNYAAFLALRGRRHQVAFGPAFWTQDYPEAGSFLEPLFHSKSINDEDSNNSAFYKNPRVDELIDRARRELDRGRRMKIYGEAQELICDEAPWAFTHHYRFYAQWHPYVHDYKPHPMWTTDPRGTWVDRLAGPVAARALFSGDALAKLFGDGP
ncbi:MAG: Dipeptide-binding transporter, periplasmic substrate-binding component [Labilithrix sp.]|nr:Dipeptide-binding transporter, periplasmic substrate-binding component [Labilithrix sp.]